MSKATDYVDRLGDLVIGVTVQAYSATLDALSSLATLLQKTSATVGATTDVLVSTSGTPERVALQDFGTRIVAANTKTLSRSDGNTDQLCTSSSNITITIPTNAVVPFPVGTELGLLCQGNGSIVVAPGAGVTLLSLTSFRTVKPAGGGAYLVKTAVDTWQLAGDIQ